MHAPSQDRLLYKPSHVAYSQRTETVEQTEMESSHQCHFEQTGWPVVFVVLGSWQANTISNFATSM